MIQRIQTLYLLIVTALMTLALAYPLATFIGDEQQFALMAFGLKDILHPAEAYVVNTYGMGAVIAAAALLAFVTIFLFKNRLLQLRLCFAQIVLQIGSLVFIAYYAYHGYKSMGVFEFSGMSFGIPAVFPLLSIIFTVLALRAIAKDERLVRSLNRIR